MRIGTAHHGGPALGVAMVMLLAAAAASAAVVELSAVTGDTLQVPGEGRITGLAWAGVDTVAVLSVIPDSLSITGARIVSLTVQDPFGEIYRTADFSGVLDRALAWDGEFLWSCGDAPDGSSILYRIEPDTLQVEEAYTAPGHRPSALAFDGRYLWLTDRDAARIDRFDPETEDFTRSVVAPGFSPFGLAWDGLRMWLTDSGTGRLYRLGGGRLRWTGVVVAEDFLYRGFDVQLVHDGNSLRYLVEGQRIAVEIDFE